MKPVAPTMPSGSVRSEAKTSGGYRMIQSAQIENFRGFVKSELVNLRRINIIVGDNGAGKTSFIEALFAAAANSPEVVLKLRTWRGMPIGGTGTSERVLSEGVWGDLFNEFDLTKIVSISLHGTDGDSRALKLSLSGEPTVFPLTADSKERGARISPVTFEWERPGKEPIRVTPELRPEGLAVRPLPDSNILGGFLAARAPFYASENAALFSDLSKNGEESEFIQAMKHQFPDIEGISVELEFGNPMLFIKHSWHSRKMPIHLLSDGMNKISAILLNLSTKRRGVVFVDEIDTGIYFRRYVDLWHQVDYFCRVYEGQLFATTHSAECLSAALPAIRQRPEDFSLVRLYRENGTSKATVASGDEALSVIESGLEVRV